MTDPWRESSDLFWKNPEDSNIFLLDPALEREYERSQGLQDANKKEDRELARWVDKIKQMPKVRLDRVRMIKDQVDAGTYVTDDKWSSACSRLREELL